ncbi:MAG: nitroreductase family protein [Actinobacteria bacterium]|nr:nitroreductase family protein [Actinomycetota bacterium]
MDFRELIRARYSVRKYLEKPVEEEKIELVLEAARLAPTAVNYQPFRLIVIEDDATRKALARAYNRSWFYNAPVIIVACGVPGEAWVRADGFSCLEVDVAIVVDHLILQATELGLGTCWIADFKPDPVREALALPAELVPLILIPLGYPGGQPRPKKRRQLTELVYRHETKGDRAI